MSEDPGAAPRPGRRKSRRAPPRPDPRGLGLLRRGIRGASPVLRLLGADPDAVEALLVAQLRVEFRRTRSGSERASFAAKLGGQLLLGTVFGAFLLVVDVPFLWMSFAQAAVLVFTTFGTLEAVPHLLLDRRDLAIVGSAPVTDTTFFVSRGFEIFLVVGLVAGSLALPIGLFGLTQWPLIPFVPTFVISTALSGALALFATLILYLGVVRAFPAHRARDVLLFAQVGLTVLIFGSIQLGPRLFDTRTLLDRVEDFGPMHLLIPPLYYGEFFRVSLGGWPPEWGLLLLGAGLPICAALGALAISSSGLLRRLQQVPGATSDRDRPPRRGRQTLLDRFVRRLLPDPIERAAFEQFRALSRRERGFRLRTYPTLALSVIFALGYLLSFLRDGPPGGTEYIALPVYFAFLYAPIFVLQTRYSDDGDARWIFDVSPIANPGRLAAGMGVGLALCFLVPVSLLISAVVVAAGGLATLPHVLVGVSFIAFSTLFTVDQVGPLIPFSEPFRPQVGMTNFGLLMLTSIVLGAAVGVHLLTAQIPGATWGLVALYAVGFRVWLERLRRRKR